MFAAHQTKVVDIQVIDTQCVFLSCSADAVSNDVLTLVVGSASSLFEAGNLRYFKWDIRYSCCCWCCGGLFSPGLRKGLLQAAFAGRVFVNSQHVHMPWQMTVFKFSKSLVRLGPDIRSFTCLMPETVAQHC